MIVLQFAGFERFQFQHGSGRAEAREDKVAAFHDTRWIVLGGEIRNRYVVSDMTRSSIELAIKIFLFCLVAVFIYTVMKVLEMVA
jgi:hypothetical protein